jgi:dynein heavy chain 1
MEDEIPSLQERIIRDEKTVNEKIKEMEEEWKQKRPYTGDIPPPEAINILNIIEKKLQISKGEWMRICKAKELLDMELADQNRLDDFEEDV